MPINIITASTTASVYNLSSVITGFVVMPGVSVSHATATPIVDVGPSADITSPLVLQVFGSVVGANNAVSVYNAINLIVGAEGLISSVNGLGVYIDNVGGAMMQGLSSITNHGVIHGGFGQSGVYFYSNYAVVTNTGLIDGGFLGVGVGGLGATVVNSGTISAALPGIANYGVQLNADGAHLSNSGLIEAVGDGASAGVKVAFGDAKLFNEGTIRSPTGWGIWADVVTVLQNRGTVEGNYGFTGSVYLGTEGSGLVNNGSLIGSVVVAGNVDTRGGVVQGDVTLGAQGNIFDGRGGTVTGSVFGMAGDDLFRTDGSQTIVEYAGHGNDTIESAASFDLAATPEVENLSLLRGAVVGLGNGLGNVIFGNFLGNTLSGAAGNDTLGGGAGNDTLRGDFGADEITGDDGDDQIFGGQGADTMNGGAGEDALWGGALNDRLAGGEGDDTLTGGTGRDTLDGGTEGDVFVFRSVRDSGVGAALRDIVLGFEAGVDQIDLSRVDANGLVSGNQAFAFVTTLTGVAGQLRVLGGANAVLQADVNGDGVADFEVQFTGVATISVNDILL